MPFYSRVASQGISSVFSLIPAMDQECTRGSITGAGDKFSSFKAKAQRPTALLLVVKLKKQFRIPPTRRFEAGFEAVNGPMLNADSFHI